MKVRIVQWFISTEHAVRMMKKLNMKAHRHMGFYFEFEEVGLLRKHLHMHGPVRADHPSDRVTHRTWIFADYPRDTEGGILTVFRDIPHESDPVEEPLVWLQKQSLPASVMAEARDARRELGKWLNEQPNRDVDKSAIATLIAVFDTLAG